MYVCMYIQNDGVAKGPPLGKVLANIFMVELEETISPSFSDKINCGKVMLMTRLPSSKMMQSKMLSIHNGNRTKRLIPFQMLF